MTNNTQESINIKVLEELRRHEDMGRDYLEIIKTLKELTSNLQDQIKVLDLRLQLLEADDVKS